MPFEEKFVNVLLIEPDNCRHDFISQIVPHSAVSIIHADSSHACIEISRQEEIDLIILDCRSSDTDWIGVVNEIRLTRMKRIPVLCLSAPHEEVDLRARMGGVIDDYILTPCSGLQFINSMNFWLGRKAESDFQKKIQVGNFSINLSEERVFLNGNEVHMPRKEYELLAFLFQNVGRIVSRQLMSMAVWGRPISDSSRTLDTHIYRLRKERGYHQKMD